MGERKLLVAIAIVILAASITLAIEQPVREKIAGNSADKHAENNDFKILVDGKDFGDGGTITAGQTINVSFVIPDGARIKNVVIRASDSAYEALLQQMLEQAKGAEISTEYQVSLPKDLPNGESSVEATVVYLDSDMNKQVYHKKTTARVVGGSSSAGILSALMPDDSRVALVNKIIARKLERISPELKIDDLTKKDLEKLKINVKQFQEARKKANAGEQLSAELQKALPQLKQTGEKKTTVKRTEALNTTDERFKKIVKELKGSAIDVEVTSQAYELSADGNTIKKTKYVVSVPSNSAALKKGEVIIQIPKDVAQKADDIEFATEPDEIIEQDPVVKWAFNNVPQNNYADYSFTVDGDTQNFDILAASAAEKPSFFSRIVNWIASFFVK